MAKDKDRTVNPAAAQRKAEKSRALKKSKAAVATQRSERLAHRNPDRLQKQIDELNDAAAAGGLKPREKQTLEQLERDVKAIRKAREALGDKAPQLRRGPRATGDEHERGVLGKRRRGDASLRSPSSSDTDPDVRSIPMPGDTPPPVPRPRRSHRGGVEARGSPPGAHPHDLPAKPAPASPAAQTVYSAAPAVRDLRKEATARFMPAAVAKKIAGVKGQGRLLEPEEVDTLEGQGYGTSRHAPTADSARLDAQNAAAEAEKEAAYRMLAAEAEMAADGTGETSLLDEERRFEREIRDVEMDEGNGQAPPVTGGPRTKLSITNQAGIEVAHGGTAGERRMQHDALAAGEVGQVPDKRPGSSETRRVEIEEVVDEDL